MSTQLSSPYKRHILPQLRPLAPKSPRHPISPVDTGHSWNIITSKINKIQRPQPCVRPVLNSNTQQLRNHIFPSLLAMALHRPPSFQPTLRPQVWSENRMRRSLQVRIYFTAVFHSPQPMIHLETYSQEWLPTKAMVCRLNNYRMIIYNYRRLSCVKTTGCQCSMRRRLLFGQRLRSRLSVYIKVSGNVPLFPP